MKREILRKLFNGDQVNIEQKDDLFHSVVTLLEQAEIPYQLSFTPEEDYTYTLQLMEKQVEPEKEAEQFAEEMKNYPEQVEVQIQKDEPIKTGITPLRPSFLRYSQAVAPSENVQNEPVQRQPLWGKEIERDGFRTNDIVELKELTGDMAVLNGMFGRIFPGPQNGWDFETLPELYPPEKRFKAIVQSRHLIFRKREEG